MKYIVIYLDKSHQLSKYLPLRFLICMISAITNPFLYSYFNETFKNGLERIFSSCCLQMNREINQISSDQTECSGTQIKSEKNLLQSTSSSYQPSNSLNGDCHSRLSTGLTIMSSNQYSTSISS